MFKKKIIIDGYNLIKSIGQNFPKLPDLESERMHLLKILSSSGILRNRDITVVFDGNLPAASQHKSQYRRLRVIFSGAGKSADDVIKILIRSDPDPVKLQIISSDRSIQYTARDHRASVTESADFWKKIRSGESKRLNDRHSIDSNTELSDKEVTEWLWIFKQRKRNNEKS